MSLINEPQSTGQNEKVTAEPLANETATIKTENATNEVSKGDVKMEVDQRPATPKVTEAAAADPCRVQIAGDLIDSLTKEELLKKWKLQSDYIDSLEQKLKLELSSKEMYQDNEDKIKQQLFDLTRKENILMMKLTTKEHEIQDYIKQIQELKLTQITSGDQLQSTFLDPAVNMIFEEMKKEVEKCKTKVEEIQNELSAWKFTPDSNTGKRLMAKCKLLYQENEELGKVISSGRIAKLEGDLALQKSFSEEMKKSQEELDVLLFELEEDVEGMQSTIYHLQNQLKEAKDALQKYQTKEESPIKPEQTSNGAAKSADQVNSKDELSVDKKGLDKKSDDSNARQPTDSSDTPEPIGETKTSNGSQEASNQETLNQETLNQEASNEKASNEEKNHENLVQQENAAKNGEQKVEERNSLERKRSLDEALEEVNASGNLTDCGIDSIIKKHRKLEQEKTQ